MDRIKKWMKKYKKYLPFLIILLSVSLTSYIKITATTEFKEIKYTEFQQMISEGKVSEVSINLKSPKFYLEDTDGNYYITDNPKDENFKKMLLENNVAVTEQSNDVRDRLLSVVMSILPLTIMLLFFKSLMKTSDIFGNKKMNQPKEDIPKVNFNNIAGNQEAKEDMQYLVNFLKNPQSYTDMGAKLPKGVIFYGPPGTGKTLTAKAIAGEAGVPFFSVSGSDFVELYVGMGAKRVRDLFENARKKAPCIIFIDEIDAVGSSRGMDRNSEKDQTINALLNEMDGFSGKEGILVIAATNRIENLDNALIRPGRFDKHIAINLPEAKDRLEILKVHAKNKKLGEDVDLEELSSLTIGFSGAGLESLLNEATIIAVNKGKSVVTREDIDDAYFKIVMQGDKKKNRAERPKKELEIVAWHEAGHALLSKLITDNEVPKVTIISSTSGAGGVTFSIPKKMGLFSKRELINRIKVSYAGRVAEYLLLGNEDEITTGASQDIKQATELIYQMINDFGMTEKFGMIRVSSIASNDKTLLLEEATEISKKLYQETLDLLTENIDKLRAVANALIEKETLNEKELDEIIFSN